MLKNFCSRNNIACPNCNEKMRNPTVHKIYCDRELSHATKRFAVDEEEMVYKKYGNPKKRTSVECKVCNVRFHSTKTLVKHVNGSMHKAKLAARNALRPDVKLVRIESRLTEPEKTIKLRMCDDCLQNKESRAVYMLGEKFAVQFILCKNCLKLNGLFSV